MTTRDAPGAGVDGPSRLRVGVDTGGTFTDVVVFDPATDAVTVVKTPSTPDNPARGFMTGLDRALAAAAGLRVRASASELGGGDPRVRASASELGGGDPRVRASASELGGGDPRVRASANHPGGDGPVVVPAAVSHGTTVATNALLADDFAGLGFITTEGFRDLLEIARQSVPSGYGNSYFWVKPPRIVPLRLVGEVPERLGPGGEVVRPLDVDAVAQLARRYRAAGVTTVGISLLHSYANPEHERLVRDVFAAEHPACVVSISSDVLREYREYERAVTTLVDAFVKPSVARYVAQIRESLDHVAAGVPFYVMKSNGGVISADEVANQPITTILSGPAAGALGAATVVRAAGYEQVLTLDGGGTSTDVCVITGGAPALTTEGSVGRFPTKVPMIDIVTVGTGGGSIAWRSPEGGLKVGPRSAGADPGPLCYGQGGTEPTVTDAHLVLGRLPPALLAGEMPLDAGAAREGLAPLATALDLSVEDCAEGVLEIAVWNQANAIRQMTVKRGLDVRDFALTAFGGSGPLQICRLIDLLDLSVGVVPLNPGNLSAFGLLTVDVRNDYVQTFVRDGDVDVAQIADTYERLEQQAGDALRRESFDREARLLRQADLRYAGQAFEVRVDAPNGSIDDGFRSAVIARFHDAHETTYGYCYRDDARQRVEWVNLRVSGIGPIARPTLRHLERGDGVTATAKIGERDVRFVGSWHITPLFARDRLRAGDEIVGPAVVEEFGSTAPVAPGFRATVDHLGNLVMTATSE